METNKIIWNESTTTGMVVGTVFKKGMSLIIHKKSHGFEPELTIFKEGQPNIKFIDEDFLYTNLESAKQKLTSWYEAQITEGTKDEKEQKENK